MMTFASARRVFAVALIGFGGAFAVLGDAAIAEGQHSLLPRYARATEPKVPPAFQPLPPGAVEPAGWLRDWAIMARDGITGHLDEYHPVFGEGWKGTPIKWTGAKPDGTGWPIEQSAYWLDGALRLGYLLHDEAIVKKIRARLDPLVDGVNRGEFGTTFLHWKEPGYKPQGFDSWAHSQIGRAMLALYQASGEQRVLDALVKVYADYPADMGEIHFGDVTGLCNLEAMMETYSYSGDERILERALKGIRNAAVDRKINAWCEGNVESGHMVITYENIRLPVVMYPWTGEGRYLQATKNAFSWLDDNHMLPYGVASGEEWAAGIGALRKTETCDIPAMLLAVSWMYRIEGDGTWGNQMERAFFNAGPAPIARDFKTACYYQSPNRIRDGELPIESLAPGKGCLQFTPLAYPRTLCCGGAVNRILPYFIANMWMATDDHGLAATLYGPCAVSALVGEDVEVKVSTATEYPFGEKIRMTVVPREPVHFPLYVRIPNWCAAPEVRVNDAAVAIQPSINRPGFVRIARKWAAGDVVTLSLPMEAKVTTGHETGYPPSIREYFEHFESLPKSMFENRSLPYASVSFGPLLFALPIPDKDPNTPEPGAKWQYALDIAPSRAAEIGIERKPMPARWNWPLDAPIVLKVPARPFDWTPSHEHALPAGPVTGNGSETIDLVPYGCTKFRISMFPLTAKVLEASGEKEVR